MTRDEIKQIASIVGGDNTYRHFVHRINKEFDMANMDHNSQVKVLFEQLNNEVVGFSVLGLSPSKMSTWNEMFIEEGWVDPSFKIDSKAFELMYMYIKPEHRKLGMGRKLLKKAFDYTKEREATELYAYVSDRNNSSLNFYTKQKAKVLADFSEEGFTTAFVQWTL